METLHWCFTVETSEGLKCNTIPVCADLLEHSSEILRGQAARLIFDLTLPQEGKQTACSTDGCISKLVKLLNDSCPFVRAQATAALMRSG